MEDWSGELCKLMAAIGSEIDQAVTEFSRDVDRAIVDFLTFSSQVSEVFGKAFGEEVDPFVEGVDQYFEGIAEVLTTLLMTLEVLGEESSEFSTDTTEPILSEHPACRGCRNYHGQVYGGNVLVCAMHPYGWEGDSCPDWESP